MNDEVELTPLKKDDLEQIRQWRNSEEVSRYMYSSSYITSEQQIAWFERIKSDNTRKYLMIKYDNKKVGLVYLTDINLDDKKCKWGLYLGNADIRDKGIGSKVEYKAIEFVFDHLKLHRMYCEVFAHNSRIIHMQEKFGFRREAYLRQHTKKDDEYLDVVIFGLLRREWLLIRKSLYKEVFNQ